ncbi:MAG: glutathione peroxidase [Crocinitomicaceae bacterium]|nr:glutathione peroxidase [Crocinitomicaceae bacterium]
MKPFFLILSIAFSFSAFSQSIYDYKVETLSGDTFDFSKLKGKKIMIVNTASKCGYTPQYEQLEAIYKQYKGKGFVVIGFPSNDFMKQEPGSNDEIAAFCQKNYGVSFPMMDKVRVKGKEMAPIYEFLTKKSLNKLEDNEVGWNFQKYLINEKGQLVRVVKSGVSPNDSSIIKWIEGK